MNLLESRMTLRNLRIKKLRQSGFTIVELMIATAVMSVILLVVSVSMITIGDLYDKGINQSLVQDNVRSIADEVSQQLEYNDGFIGPTSTTYGGTTVYAYCIGSTRYSYVLGQQVVTTVAHVLWRDTNTAAGCVADNLTRTTPSKTGTELIAPGSRLTYFSITQATSTAPYAINLEIALGSDDKFCNTAVVPGSCAPGTTTMPAGPAFQGNTVACKAQEGQEFCATSALNITVVQRISSS